MKFSRSALTSASGPSPSLAETHSFSSWKTTDLQEVVLTFVTLTLLADLKTTSPIYLYVSRLLRVHAFNNNADTSIPCLTANSSFSPVGMILHSECIFAVRSPLNSGAYSIHSALSNLISGYSSTRLLYHLNTRKRR